MTTVMVSGHFDGFHADHFEYLERARLYGDMVICVVSSDRQLMMKKGKVNIPERKRLKIAECILRGFGYDHLVVINEWDKETAGIAEALRQWKPDILLRGFDKSPDDLPKDEWNACHLGGIKVVYLEERGENKHNLHASEMAL